MDMTIELAQRIKDNQRIHLESTLLAFATVPVMAPAPQMAVTSFTAQTQDSNKQLIDRLTANLAWLLESLAQTVRDNQQSQRPRFEPRFNQPQQLSYQKQQNHGLPVCYCCGLTGHISKDCNNPFLFSPSKSASQPEENLFYALNLTNDDHDMDKLTINTSDSTKKKKKAKVDFVLDSNKASTSTTDNNKPPKAKVFKNPPKLESPEITPKTNKRPCQAGLADNSNVTPLICKAQVAGYFIDLILNSRLFVSIIAKHFLEAIGRKIDKPSTQPMTNIYDNKKKDLGIAKAVPVQINDISIETNIEVSEAKEYTIIVNNEWLKKAKALLNYKLCELTIRCNEKPIVVKYRHWTTPSAPKQSQEKKQSNKSDDNESDDKKNQEEQKKTAELTYIIFTSNGKPLDNVKADKEKIIVNGKLICWFYYDILKKIFDRKPGKKAKYSYWWHGPCAYAGVTNLCIHQVMNANFV
ncbi:hypothetical protein G9A89_007803 [Geosiphon pyriformis]|nr:hypothetical protein G9A89_007803 [Geosiphon pyriformis]